MKERCTLILISLCFLFPSRGWCWGQLGHRVTGAIAESYLTPKTKAAIKNLLGNESIAMASVWADFIKSDRSYDSLNSWHYVNLPSGLSEPEVYRRLDNDKGVNLYTKTNFIIRELKSNRLSKDKQVYYLKLLIHFVGDAHQPMHMGRSDDRGGNGIKLYWFKVPTNLHRVWDEQLIEFQQLSYTEHAAAINFPTAAQKEKWQRQPIKGWLYESYLIAQRLYSDVRTEDKLMYNYNYKYQNIMNEQLLKGGVRLAAVLNDIFGR